MGKTSLLSALSAVLILGLAGCGSLSGRMVQIKGSDTMVNLVQILAEAFMEADPGNGVAVLGGGSGTGITGLINGTCDIANVCTDEPLASPEFNVRAHVLPHRWLTFFVLNTGGIAYDWFQATMCREMTPDEFYGDYMPATRRANRLAVAFRFPEPATIAGRQGPVTYDWRDDPRAFQAKVFPRVHLAGHNVTRYAGHRKEHHRASLHPDDAPRCGQAALVADEHRRVGRIDDQVGDEGKEHRFAARLG